MFFFFLHWEIIQAFSLIYSFQYLKQYKCLAVLILTSGLELLRGFIMSIGIVWGVKWITDGCVDGDYNIFLRGIVLFTVSICFSTFAVYFINQTLKKKIILMKSKLRITMVERVLYGDYELVKDYDKNDMLFKVNNNVGQVSKLYSAIQLGIGSVGKIAGSIIAGYFLSWHLTVVLLAFGLVKILIDKKMVSSLYGIHNEINNKKSIVFSTIFQMIQGITFYKLTGDERSTSDIFNINIEKYRYLNRKSITVESNIDTISSAIEIFALLCVLFMGSFLIKGNIITVGAFVAFVSMYDVLINPYKFISTLMREYQENKTGCIKIFEIIGVQYGESKVFDVGNIIKSKFSIKIDALNFGYDKNNIILKDVNFKANSGEVTYIVGKSGAGKSTLFNIINGLYKPLSGKISLETSKGLCDAEFHSSIVTCVSQTPFLFNGTISENIALTSKDKIDETRLKEAIKKAGIKEFIQDLPNQYEHEIKDKGKNFSGGQRCRLALARVFYNPSPIILLDEIYASLDNIIISTIEKSVDELCSDNHCVLVISHRNEWIPNNANVVNISNN